MNDNKEWWQKPLRVIQTNLQVKDTPSMNPAKIAGELQQMGANALVFNVGGIYAWYSSRVKYHHVNEFLPKDFDLLEAMIRECHARDIRFIARMDFSKAEDSVFEERPRWFVRDAENKPKFIGKDRRGEWSLLLSTCMNGGYRNEEVALPVMREVLQMYGIDGVFMNAPTYEFCHCPLCKEKYRALYGKELPERSDELEPSFAAVCVRDNIGKLYRVVKEHDANIPFIIYYHPWRGDKLNERLATADMLCTEPMDSLSRGYADIPQTWLPAVDIKIGLSAGIGMPPFGIVHSCPGMEWRHTGFNPAEYRFWMSQVPANGGSIWHSLTGFGDTITDKRIIDTVTAVNADIQKIENDMDGAKGCAETLLLWQWKTPAHGWAEGLVNTHIQFDVLSNYQLSAERLARYRVVIVPEAHPVSEILPLLRDWVKSGGRLILEGSPDKWSLALAELIGVGPDIAESESLAASYCRLEGENNPLAITLERTPLLPHQGVVNYCTPLEGTVTLATLVPPFAPVEAVGAPPERASLPVAQTDIPLCILREFGSGKVMYFSFQLSSLAVRFKLGEHFRLMKNAVGSMLTSPLFEMEPVSGIQASVFRKGNCIYVHLVNGIGQRPLSVNVPFHNLSFSIRPDKRKVISAVSKIGGNPVETEARDGRVYCRLSKLDVWDMIEITLGQR